MVLNHRHDARRKFYRSPRSLVHESARYMELRRHSTVAADGPPPETDRRAGADPDRRPPHPAVGNKSPARQPMEGSGQWRTQEFSKDQGITLRGASRSAGGAVRWSLARGAPSLDTGEKVPSPPRRAPPLVTWAPPLAEEAPLLAKEAPSPAGRSCFFKRRVA